MIQFRCWYCSKSYIVADQRIGERLACTCKHILRVPRRSGGSCRVRTITDWLVETIVYGGGGGLLGLGLALVIVAQSRPFMPSRVAWALLTLLPLAGLLVGLLGGERGIGWIGRFLRERESR